MSILEYDPYWQPFTRTFRQIEINYSCLWIWSLPMLTEVFSFFFWDTAYSFCNTHYFGVSYKSVESGWSVNVSKPKRKQQKRRNDNNMSKNFRPPDTLTRLRRRSSAATHPFSFTGQKSSNLKPLLPAWVITRTGNTSLSTSLEREQQLKKEHWILDGCVHCVYSRTWNHWHAK